MSKILLESDFLTVDLKAISTGASQKTASQPQDTEKAPSKDKNNNPSTPATKAKNTNARIDWSKELKKRLDANAALSPEAREKEFDIKNKFWLEFFTAFYGEEVAELLNNIELLKKDIQILKFNKQAPIIAFFKAKYVQTELVKTKLINSNTYKVIHNAFAKQLVSDFEFLKANEYNILYCRDLYNRPPAEIEKYLELQKQILPANTATYDEETISKNKKVFLDGSQKTVKAKAAKLKSLKEIESLYKLATKKKDKDIETDTTEDETSSEETDAKTFNARTHLAAFIKTKEHVFATLQYLGMTAKSTEANKTLANFDFGQLDGSKLVNASKEIAERMAQYKITKNDVKEILELITRKVRN